jgi:ketosteroid isomerase-like protein
LGAVSEGNVERFRRGVEAVNRGDVEAGIDLIDPDVSWEPLRAGVSGVYRGHAGIRRFFADSAEIYESMRIDYTEVRDLGDGRILAIGKLHVRGRGSGIEIDVSSAGIAIYRDGLLVRWKDFGDPAAARRAAGISD